MAKGGSFERTIAKELSLWFSNDERDDLFWRTAGSGARATTRMKKGVDTANSAGDIAYLHPTGKPFVDLCLVEIKRGYNKKKTSQDSRLSVLLTLDIPMNRKNKPVLIKWWEKAEEERKVHGRKYSIIIFRRDRHNACICMDYGAFQEIEKRNKKPFTFPKCGNWIVLQERKACLIMLLLDDFFDWCKPSALFRKIKRRKK